MLLKTDYQDDILDLTQNANRKFNEITNQDGSKSFEDVTEYEQEGTPFGAQDVNAITKALTDETHGVSFQFGIDGNGDYGYIKDGETEVTPFRNRHTETIAPNSRALVDMGLYHKIRYADLSDVPNINSGTQTINAVYTSGNGLDLGATNSVRYIKTNGLMKIPTAKKIITANGNNLDVLEYSMVDVNVRSNLYIKLVQWTNGNDMGTNYNATVLDTGATGGHNIAAWVRIGHLWDDDSKSGTLYLQGSNDNSSWTNLTSVAFSHGGSSTVDRTLSSYGSYRYFRIHFTSNANESVLFIVMSYNAY